MLSLPEIAARAVIAAPALPALAVAAIGGYALLVRNPRESTTAGITLAALVGSLIASLLGAGAILVRGGEPIHVPLGAWFEVGGYSFHTSLHLDTTSATMLVLTTVITSLVARFSRSYLHREAGFTRFFLLLGVFAAGMQLLVAAGTFDILFAGWELVGLSSVLLVAFFHERTAPVRASLRVFVVYRLCDIGLLVGAALLHRAGHGSEIGDLHFEQVAPATATAISLAFLLAAMGKSAQFPLGGWLPRAMEGPTPSSALFYGALSVHAGVFLLLRAAPVLARAPIACAVIVVVGAMTAVVGTLCWRVQSDAKSALAFATTTQVGLMFVEVGLGFHRVALVHMVAHASLRTWQMLRAPSALEDADVVRAVHQGRMPVAAGFVAGLAPLRLRSFVYRLALDRFQLEAFENAIVAPVTRIAMVLSLHERRFTQLLEVAALAAALPGRREESSKRAAPDAGTPNAGQESQR